MPHVNPLDAGPTRRKLRELRARGFTESQVAAATGRPPAVIGQLPYLRLVSPATADAVERAHEALLGPAPETGVG